jgi:hypothetical protein
LIARRVSRLLAVPPDGSRHAHRRIIARPIEDRRASS